jgi:hypothetical protein
MAYGPISAFWSTAPAQIKALLIGLASISNRLKELLPLSSATVQIAHARYSNNEPPPREQFSRSEAKRITSG